MKLYKPVLIETAEQAEALPEEVIAISEEFAPEAFVKVGPNEWFGTHGPGTMTDLTAVGWTALVPIEAEEETDTLDYMYGKGPSVRRLVTAWEES